MYNNQCEVQILVGNQLRPAKEYSQYIDGEYRTFIEGRAENEYAIKIKNNSYKKVLALIAIDSVNVVTGKIQKSPTAGRGYIINGYDSVTIRGYRESDSTVGAFKFTNKENSYASEKGVGHNSGVIAVTIVEEKVYSVVSGAINNEQPWNPATPKFPPFSPETPWNEPMYRCALNNSIQTGGMHNVTTTTITNSAAVTANNFVQACSFAPAPDFQLGSSWGQRVEDKITRKHFEKGNTVASFKIYYNNRQGLQNMGIQMYPEKQINVTATQWPNAYEGYAKPPKNWH